MRRALKTAYAVYRDGALIACGGACLCARVLGVDTGYFESCAVPGYMDGIAVERVPPEAAEEWIRRHPDAGTAPPVRQASRPAPETAADVARRLGCRGCMYRDRVDNCNPMCTFLIFTGRRRERRPDGSCGSRVPGNRRRMKKCLPL